MSLTGSETGAYENPSTRYCCDDPLNLGSASLFFVELPNGNVQFVKMTYAEVGESTLSKGDIKIEETFSDEEIHRDDEQSGVNVFNSVAQHIQVIKNQAHTIGVAGNTASESIECLENTTNHGHTIIGGPNTAPNIEGQCFQLSPP